MSSGYYQKPTLHEDSVVFVSEDDLWSVPIKGGVARRLTANPGRSSEPHFSPDGAYLAFTNRDEGHPEVHLMDARGGESRRLTYLGADTVVVGWSGEHVYFATNRALPFRRMYALGRVHIHGGLPEIMPWGPANAVAFGPRGQVVVGRHTWDPARWKRYRGGTVGQLWIADAEEAPFRSLIQLDGNVTRPVWVGERVYFGSDHEGVCNLYSCRPNGRDLRRHTDLESYYLRHPATDGRRIVYQAGADLHLYDPASDKSRKIPIEYRSPRPHRQRRFVNPYTYLEDSELHPKGTGILAVVRGRPFAFAHWEEGVIQLGERDGVRYRLSRWLNDCERILTISDRGGEEHLELHWLDGRKPPEALAPDFDLGRALTMEISPTRDQAFLTNHRHELLLADLKEKTVRVLDRSPYDRIHGACWSPSGLSIAYSFTTSLHVSQLRLYLLNEDRWYELTRPQFRDVAPNFDPEGRYLYFLSYREFDPVYDNHYFDAGFPKGMRPYCITMRADLPSPFLAEPRAPGENGKSGKSKDENGEDKKKRKKDEPEPLPVDLEGIQDRVIALPVTEGIYGRVVGLSDQILFTSFPVEGSLGSHWSNSREPAARGTLWSYEFKSQETKELATKVTDFKLSRDRKTLAYRSGWRLRVLQAGKKAESTDTTPSRKTGWLALSRVRVSVNPVLEWRQMFREAWRLMREHFWTADLSGVDWDGVYQEYLPLLKRISTRSELSDLLWEMQGELGTSHAYEMGGDYPSEPGYHIGHLGADLRWDDKRQAYRVDHVLRGDSWDPTQDSPLNRVGLDIRKGDFLLAIDGVPLTRQLTPEQLLVNQAGMEVQLTLRRGRSKPRRVFVKTLRDETLARYREWVETNRNKVHQASGGRVGYIHIPNMGPWGFSEFHRSYFSEVDREGLVVDVRYNGGGNVSQMLLEKLSRRRIGYDFQRWGQPAPYPADSPGGPLVAITNELAGSDGDIFSHCFKLLKLGPLVGKRTWGGVIGIWPRHRLVDGTITTQPEFAFWFEDVGWALENYGTDPDVEVELTPQDWARGRDPQLDKALELILQALERQPPAHPGDPPRPLRTRPRLPRRK
ncbi:MAG: tricorn protease [Candidatus Xenobia bacterium]